MVLSAIPAFAQVDFSGEWSPRFYEDEPERVPGPELGDYLGLPINDAARERADTWAASIQSMPEWQCRPHSADYIWRGPSQLRITKEVDPVTRQVTAFHAEWLRSVDNIYYLDGRPAPLGQRASHVGWFCDGEVGRRHVDDQGDSSQRRIRSPQRRSAQRSRYRDRALDASW